MASAMQRLQDATDEVRFEPRRGGVLRISDLGGAVSAIGMVIPEEKVKTTEYVRSPEVILGERELTPAVDLWALGGNCSGLVLRFFGVLSFAKH